MFFGRMTKGAREGLIKDILLQIGDENLEHYITVSCKEDILDKYAYQHPELKFVDSIPDVLGWYTGMFYRRKYGGT